MKRGPKDQSAKLRQASRKQSQAGYVLTLYVAGVTHRSSSAIRSVTDICEQYLKDRYELEIIDIYQQPGFAKTEQIVVAPTLIKRLPTPLRRLIGDMANKERVLVGLDLRKKKDEPSKPGKESP